jgi:hypothetical protein
MLRRVNLKALLKRGELLGHLEAGNQQPSCVGNRKAMDAEGSETREKSEDVSPRALRTIGIPKYLLSNCEDIVRTAVITK